MASRLSLRVRLVLLVAGTMLPLIAFAGALVYRNHIQQEEQVAQRVLEVARNIRRVLDTETRAVVAGLEVLAQSQALQRDDIESFRTDAMAFLKSYSSPESSISVADRAGNQIFNSGVPAGQAPPPLRNPVIFEKVFQTRAPAYSRLFTGSVLKKNIITINVPVFRDDEVIYALSINPPLGGFQSIIEAQRPSADWTISIFDQTGVNFARVPNPEQTVGKRASPTLFAEMFKQQEAFLPTVSLEGVPLLSAYTHSQVSGWIVAPGIARETLTAPLFRTLAITAAIGAALLLIGLAFAVGMATAVARGEAMNALLINELNHRVKNTLATVQSIASRTFRGADPAEARQKFDARLVALGRAHDILSEQSWHSADIRDVIERVLDPFVAKDKDRLFAAGPPLRLSPRCALVLSMVLHELATNATKYGGLSVPGGHVKIAWDEATHDDEQVAELTWSEHGGPPVTQPTRQGFGSTLIEQSLASQIGGRAHLSYAPGGLICTISCPLA